MLRHKAAAPVAPVKAVNASAATATTLPPEWASLGDRLVCLLGTEPVGDVLRGYGMDRWDAGGCGVLAAALAPLMAERGVPNARSYAIVVPRPSDGSGDARAQVISCVVGNSLAGPFFDAAGWHLGDALRARAGPRARIVPIEARVGPVAGPVGVVCPHGAVRDLRRTLERYIDTPFIVVYDSADALARAIGGSHGGDDTAANERRLPQLWTWDDPATAARLYLTTSDGPMPVNEHGSRLPPHYREVARLARQDPHRQSCLTVGATRARRHPTA
jgi:hypothetical protein